MELHKEERSGKWHSQGDNPSQRMTCDTLREHGKQMRTITLRVGDPLSELDKTRIHPDACTKAQQEPVGKSGATSPHMHRRSANADKRMPKSCMQAKREVPECQPYGKDQCMSKAKQPWRKVRSAHPSKSTKWRSMRKPEVARMASCKCQVWRGCTKEKHTTRQAMNTRAWH